MDRAARQPSKCDTAVYLVQKPLFFFSFSISFKCTILCRVAGISSSPVIVRLLQ
ncbi:MAG: hypothetical protein GY796_07845 [Chloroflexi bacterium]|nr:hypothetical protein [Chloroflexota bacterium]